MSQKYLYNDVKKYIESQKYTLISTEYINCKSKLEMSCEDGHISYISFDRFKSGDRCQKCYNLRRSSTQRRDVDNMRMYIESQGYTLVDVGDYINDKSKIHMRCIGGHDVIMRFSKFQQGQRCKKCIKEYILPNKQSNNTSYIREYIEPKGYILSTEYLHGKQKLKLTCPKSHTFEMIWNNFQQGQRCPICFSESFESRKEISVYEYVQSLTPECVIRNDRTTVFNTNTGRFLELDIYLPKSKKAIEFNGSYWHSFESVVVKDKYKKNKCREMGIDLMVIEESYYDGELDLCLTKIKEFINGNN